MSDREMAELMEVGGCLFVFVAGVAWVVILPVVGLMYLAGMLK